MPPWPMYSTKRGFVHKNDYSWSNERRRDLERERKREVIEIPKKIPQTKMFAFGWSLLPRILTWL